jgi:hypothetical protein
MLGKTNIKAPLASQLPMDDPFQGTGDSTSGHDLVWVARLDVIGSGSRFAGLQPPQEVVIHQSNRFGVVRPDQQAALGRSLQ